MAWSDITMPTDTWATIPKAGQDYMQDQNGDYMQMQDGTFVETQESLGDSWTDIS